MKKLLYISLIVLLTVILIVSSIYVIREIKEEKKQENIFSDIENGISISDNTQENSIKENDNLKDTEQQYDYTNLYMENNDMVGWIKIDGTNINFPVMQSKSEPNYYLHRNFYKNYSSYGTPYISENCKIGESKNLIIYGHHIKNGKMFANLVNYKSENFYKTHKIINFNTLDEKNKYEIVYAFLISTDDNFKYTNYTNFESYEEFQYFNSKCKEHSLYDTKVESNYNDYFITLTTCEYSQNNGRIVIVAKKS